MKKLSNYMIRKIGSQLAKKLAQIDGKTCTGNIWPEGDHYWIITSFIDQTTYHVEVERRPTWDRYYAV